MTFNRIMASRHSTCVDNGVQIASCLLGTRSYGGTEKAFAAPILQPTGPGCRLRLFWSCACFPNLNPCPRPVGGTLVDRTCEKDAWAECSRTQFPDLTCAHCIDHNVFLVLRAWRLIGERKSAFANELCFVTHGAGLSLYVRCAPCEQSRQ